MAKLIERIRNQTLADGKPIDLDNLWINGTEFIDVQTDRYGNPSEDIFQARRMAESQTLETAKKNGSDYAMIGKEPIVDPVNYGHYTFVASFYRERK